MSKAATPRDKYFLRDVHQEIAFYDRKIAYLETNGEFASPAEREDAEKKLMAKRAPLEKTALELVASGVEYDEKDLPRSLRASNAERKDGAKGATVAKSS